MVSLNDAHRELGNGLHLHAPFALILLMLANVDIEARLHPFRSFLPYYCSITTGARPEVKTGTAVSGAHVGACAHVWPARARTVTQRPVRAKVGDPAVGTVYTWAGVPTCRERARVRIGRGVAHVYSSTRVVRAVVYEYYARTVAHVWSVR